MHPISFASRFSRVERKRIDLERPSAVENYNKCMGGTDRMDQNIGYYRIGVRKNKWWWSIFTWLIDVPVQNAWLLQRKAGMKSISQFQFRRNIAQHCCHAVALSVANNRPHKRARLPEEDRYDERDHMPVPGTRRRCANPTCNSRTRVKCEKCDVGLCVDKICFKSFHYTL